MTNSTDQSTVLLVRHCGPDTASLERFITDQLDEPRIKSIATADEAEQWLSENDADAVLVNRVIPQTDERGQDWIGRMREQYPDIPFLLISNHEDAQEAAKENGAAPGFGKRDLGTQEAAQKLRKVFTESLSKKIQTIYFTNALRHCRALHMLRPSFFVPRTCELRD